MIGCWPRSFSSVCGVGGVAGLGLLLRGEAELVEQDLAQLGVELTLNSWPASASRSPRSRSASASAVAQARSSSRRPRRRRPPCGPAPAPAAPRPRRGAAQALGVEGGEQRATSAVDGQRPRAASCDDGAASPPRSSWPSGGGVPVGQLQPGVARRAAPRAGSGSRPGRAGRRPGGVEREARHVDAEAQQRPQQRLGVVGGQRRGGRRQHRARARRTAVVGQQLGGQPRPPRPVGVDHSASRRAGCGPRPAHAAATADRGRPARRGPGGGLGRRRPRSTTSASSTSVGRATAGAPEVPCRGLGEAVEQRAELEEVEQPRTSSTSTAPRSIVGAGLLSRSTSRAAPSPRRSRAPGLVLGEVLAQLRGLLVEVGEDAVEAAVGGDQLGRGLLPHPGHAGQVVGRVAPQRGVLT
jgi:hypothetical protein